MSNVSPNIEIPPVYQDLYQENIEQDIRGIHFHLLKYTFDAF